MKKRSDKTEGPIRPIVAESRPDLPPMPPDPDSDPISFEHNPPAIASAHSEEKASQSDDGAPRSSAAPRPASRLPLSHVMLTKRAAAAKASTSISSEIPPMTAPSSDLATIQDVKAATTEPASSKVSVRHSIPKPPVSSASSPASKSAALPTSKTSLSRRPAVSQLGATVPLSSTRASGFRSTSMRQASSGPPSPSPSSASLVRLQTNIAPNPISRSPGITLRSLPKRSTSVIPRSQPTSSASIGASLSPARHTATTAPARKPASSSRDTLASVGLVVKELSTAARDGSDLFLPLKAALVGVVALREIFEDSVEVEAQFAKLGSRVLAFNVIAETREAALNEAKRSLKTYLDSIAQAVQALWQALEQKHAHDGVVETRASINLGSRPAQPKRNMDDVLSLVERITALLEIFEVVGTVAIKDRLAIVLSRIALPQAPDKASTASLSIANHTGNTTYNFGRDVWNNNYVNNYLFTQKQEDAIKTIKSILGDRVISEAADYAQHSSAGCMPGTRKGVLSKFVTWVAEDPMAIIWLAGMAGTGKTSIAVTLCRMLRGIPEIVFGGGYFCSRSAGSIARTDVRRILPTLATILAGASKDFAEALVAELEKDHDLGHKPVADQMGPLMRQPLEKIASSSRRVVFLIDALDECSDELELAELLTLIADSRFDGKVKFILTSRPELHIRGTPISNPEHNAILQLHTISLEEVTSDIRFYIVGTLNNLAPKATWYTDHDIGLLVQLSAGLFIFASTVLKYVLYRTGYEDRRERLRKATTAGATAAGTSSIDKIYELVLVDASQSDLIEDDELERMKDVLACILSARASLSVEALASLIGVSPDGLRGSLERLHSLIHLPDDDTLPGVRTLHASLGDYLFERAPQHIRIATTLGHDLLARGCVLRFAKDDLHFNISQCRSSFDPTQNGAADGIPLSLIYACLHWAHHIDFASSRSAFDGNIGRFFRAKFLFWLEVLCVLGKARLASGLLRIAASAVKESTTSKFLRDANVFVASSYGAISRSAPHIYVSALPFASKDSLVYRDFMPFCTGLLSVTTFGINRHGGRLVATLVGHEGNVNSVSYSRDGRHLASGSEDGTVRIWDTLTGDECISPLRSNDGGILSVAFAPDGHRVASGGEGKAVHVWSLATGQPILPAMHHLGAVESVTFSPDGALIASGSADHSVSLWSSTTGQKLFALNGHTNTVLAVAFSPDSRLVASASWDETIRLWNARTGEAVGSPFVGHNGSVMCVAFSPDGKLLAGADDEGEARIWNIEEPGSNLVAIHGQSALASVAFSPNGSKLFSATFQPSIRCWNSQTWREIPGSSLAGHASEVFCISISQDGRFLASGSADRTVRIWDIVDGIGEVTQPMTAHSRSVSSVAVSHDGTSIISGSADRSVRIWNPRTGAAILPPLLGHSGSITSVAISSDGRLIASASRDQTVRMWDAQTGVPVGDPLRGHSDTVSKVAFSPDARWLASGSHDKCVRVWDVRASPTLFNLLNLEQPINSVAFSPDGRFLVAAGLTDHIHLWISGTNQRARESIQAIHEGIRSVFFSPDSKRIGTRGETRGVYIWDIESGHNVLSLMAGTSIVSSAAYSPDGRYIISSSEDKTIRIWDAENGAAISSLPSHTGVATSLVFTPDGMFTIFCDFDSIHIWNVEEALSLPSQAKHDATAALGCAAFDEDGWLVESSGELLLWVPPEYRDHLQLSPCSMIIGSRRVVLNAGDGIHWGEQWAACWRNVPLSEGTSL